MELFGFKVKVVFLVSNNDVLAYSWHYTDRKALKHMEKMIEFHNLSGKIMESANLEKWLKEKLEDVIIGEEKFSLPEFNYANKRVYEEILKIRKGEILTYSDIAKYSGIKFPQLLITLMRNPFQILIPCHRLLTKKGTLMGFYPLGIEVKKKLLEIGGIKI